MGEATAPHSPTFYADCAFWNLLGVGWGLAGLCPGPAIAGLGLIPEPIAVFVVTMMLSSWVTGHLLERSSNRKAALQTLGATSE